MGKFRLPEALAFVVLSGAAVASTSCDSDDPKRDGSVADAGRPDGSQDGCLIYCIPDQFLDDGGMVDDDAGVKCPMCADESTMLCPSGCRPVG